MEEWIVFMLKGVEETAESTIEMVLKCYDWAAGQHDGCVVSGFSSKLEQDVLHFLLKVKCPIILVLARRMYKVQKGEQLDKIEPLK
jgi:hypothetical protein